MRSGLLTVCSRVMFLLNLVLCEHCQYSSSRKRVKSETKKQGFPRRGALKNLPHQPWKLGQQRRSQATLPYMQSKQIREATPVAYIEAQLSQLTGLARPSLYRSLCGQGNPSFQTMCRVLDAMGYTVTVKRKETEHE